MRDRPHCAVLIAILLAPIVAGCITPPEEDPYEPRPGTYRVGGAFNENVTSDDLDRFSGLVHDRGGVVMIMESWPPQFDAYNLPAPDDCEAVRTHALVADHVASVGECRMQG